MSEQKDPKSLKEALKIIEDLKNDKAELNEVIEDLRKDGVPAGEKPTFTLDGQTYSVNAGSFILNKKTYTAAEVVKSKDLQKKLLLMRIGFIKKVKK